ncbi:MAG: NAD(P)/FAD-dependent oxidoreductase [Ruminococcus sp.]|nr:NAD(P)/FAD-dependent oxidoreductase [Ruminococcus sp.]
MKKTFDVIIIGAGNAGLMTAATLAKGGLKPLVLERNLVPGGCATSFVRGRFEFEPSLHELANVGTKENPGSVRKLFESLGADVTWVNETNAFRVIAQGKDGYDAAMPAGIEAFCDEMERQVPSSRQSVLALFECAEKVEAALNYFAKGKPDPVVMMTEHADFMRMASHSVDECLDALKMPKKAQNIIKTYWPYLGASTDKLDLAHYLLMMARYIAGSPAMPSMKSHELSLAVEKVIKDNGGDIWYNTEVTEILTENGKAVGVKTKEREIFADFIVANCFPDTAYSKMMKAEDVPEKGVKLANARKKGEMFFTVYLGLNRSAEELGIKDYSVFLYDSPDALKQYQSMDRFEESFVIVNCLNNVVKDSSPQGTCTLFFTTMLSEKGWTEVKPENYKKLKNRMAEQIISAYESRMGISVKPFIEEISVATPVTFARYLNTPNGTPYGYEIQPWDTMIARIMNGKNEMFTKNLYFVGAHGDRADGYSSAYSNGNSTAGRILREVKQNG